MELSKKQKSMLIVFFVIMTIFLILVGGYYTVKTLYPIDYTDIIEKYSKEYDVDPYLICAVINTESSFKSSAQSHKGAMGLMQLMPDTAKWIASKLSEEYDADALTAPESNIRYGTWYLKYLLKRYDGDISCAAAAYNAGHSNVDEWKKTIADGDSIDVSKIPFKETKNYVRKVDSAYDIYKRLYPGM